MSFRSRRTQLFRLPWVILFARAVPCPPPRATPAAPSLAPPVGRSLPKGPSPAYLRSKDTQPVATGTTAPADSSDEAVLAWLLDSDPALHWQVERALVGAPAEVWEATRARVTEEGFGARLLALQDPDGQWSGGAYFPARGSAGAPDPGDTEQPWTATTWSLGALRSWGCPAEALGATPDRLERNARWEYDDLPYWDGEVDVCINAFTLANGLWLGRDMDALAQWFVDHAMDEGGWNCEWVEGSTRASVDSTINALEGLLEYERGTGGHGRNSEHESGTHGWRGLSPRTTGSSPTHRRQPDRPLADRVRLSPTRGLFRAPRPRPLPRRRRGGLLRLTARRRPPDRGRRTREEQTEAGRNLASGLAARREDVVRGGRPSRPPVPVAHVPGPPSPPLVGQLHGLMDVVRRSAHPARRASHSRIHFFRS